MPDRSARAGAARDRLRPVLRDRRTWVVLLGTAILLASVIVLARPAAPVSADDTEHAVSLKPLAPITPQSPTIQQFTARADRLSEVLVRFGTYGGVTDCAVRAELRSGTDELMDRRIECADMPDSSLVVLAELAPQEGSNDRDYELRLSAEPGSVEAISMWGVPSSDSEPAATGAPNPDDLAVEVHTRYARDDTVAGNVGLMLHRMAQFGPPWRTPVVIVGLALAALGLLVALMLNPRRALLLLVAFAIAKGLLWSMVVPPLEGVDEVAHYGYAQFMAVDHHIPQRGVPRDDLQPPDYSREIYAAMDEFHQTAEKPSDRPDYSTAEVERAKALLGSSDTHSGGVGAAAGYPPVYYAPASLLYAVSSGTIDSKVGYMRLWSIALGAITVWLVYLIGMKLFPRHPRAAVALAVAVALQPMASQEQAIINNDALVIAAGAWCLLLALTLAEPARLRRPVVPLCAGVAAGVAILGKPFGAIYLPVLGYAWIVGLRRGTAETRAWRNWIRDAAAAAVGFLATYGVWFAFGALFNYKFASVNDLNATDNPKTLGAFLRVLTDDAFLSMRRTWVDQFWGNLSWVDTPLPKRVQGTITVLLVLLLLGIAWWVVRATVDGLRRRRARTGATDRADETADLDVRVSVCVVTIAAIVATLYLLAYSAFRRTGDNSLIQGRYALLVLPAVLALPALLLQRARPRINPAWITGAVAAGLLLLNITGLGLLGRHFYL